MSAIADAGMAARLRKRFRFARAVVASLVSRAESAGDAFGWVGVGALRCLRFLLRLALASNAAVSRSSRRLEFGFGVLCCSWLVLLVVIGGAPGCLVCFVEWGGGGGLWSWDGWWSEW